MPRIMIVGEPSRWPKVGDEVRICSYPPTTALLICLSPQGQVSVTEPAGADPFYGKEGDTGIVTSISPEASSGGPLAIVEF